MCLMLSTKSCKICSLLLSYSVTDSWLHLNAVNARERPAGRPN
jgi:hypothetical protein